MRVCRSPKLIAAYRGLHRLYVPRHPPHTFVRLTLSHCQAERTLSNKSNRNITRSPPSLAVTSKRCRLTEVLRPSRTAPTDGRSNAVVPTITSHFRCQIAQTHAGPSLRRAAVNNRIRDRGCAERAIYLGLSVCRPEGPTYSSLQKGGDPAAGSPTATLLRLRPSHCARLRRLGPLRVPAPTSGAHSFHGVTGGVYKARERIHRGVADPRLLAIPASCRRVADDNPN